MRAVPDAMRDTPDRRRFNNPHHAVMRAGADAARIGIPLHACPYRHPAMRASWLQGFAQEQQQRLDF
ncbi:CrpP family ICE-associated protein [Pseudomonas syringae group genomosp. 3]|uniref:CrpP family ICE-associated protein n=1 Tax=Pseudomonas syringae group genomosp. 3 TaxID=251701 RepID=UPI00217DDAC7|nr:CrpP family ICE-associated protein [Pseudomonas syringae group genomosp. 3]